MEEERDERPNPGSVSIRNKNGAPSRKGCVVNGQMTAKRQAINEYPSPHRSVALAWKCAGTGTDRNGAILPLAALLPSHVRERPIK